MKQKVTYNFLIILTAAILASCTTLQHENKNQSEKYASKFQGISDTKKILSIMTTEEKVAQLFVVMPEQLAQNSITTATKRLSIAARQYPVGGFALFSRHIENPEQLRAFTRGLQKISELPPIIAVDEEGGLISRLANSRNFSLPKFSPAETIGATKNTANARNEGRTIGKYLQDFGFNMDFAPVADVNTNPENVVIGSRAFGSDPALVSKMVGAFLQGLHKTKTKGCIKHFPGHGDTNGDTHSDYVALTKTWDEIKKCELIPFVQNFALADSVMVAHVTVPDVDPLYPASLSKLLISGKLREELGYKGIILTDALNMGAIEKNYGSGEACVLAFEAGNDILLMPKNFYAAYDAVLEAVSSGRISTQRLDESVLRILEFKCKQK